MERCGEYQPPGSTVATPLGWWRRARRARCEAVNLVENFTWSTGGIMCMDTSTLVWKMCVCIYIINIYIHIQFGLFEVNWSFEETKTTSEFFFSTGCQWRWSIVDQCGPSPERYHDRNSKDKVQKSAKIVATSPNLEVGDAVSDAAAGGKGEGNLSRGTMVISYKF